MGGIGYLVWRRYAKKKRVTELSELPGGVPQHHEQHQPHPSESKAGLPGEPGTYPSDYARSPSGLHEAP
jgi:hypothetical protein